MSTIGFLTRQPIREVQTRRSPGRSSPGFVSHRVVALRKLAAPASTATTATGTTAGAAAAPIAAATAALRLGSRFVDHEIAVTEEAPVQHLDCFLGFLFGRHLHEPETPRPAGELVGGDPDRLDGAGLGEELAEILLRRLEGQVAYEQLSG